MWCVPHLDETYLNRMEDVLNLYERPYNASEPVICIDEKPVVLHENARASIRLANGALRRDFEYRRYGTANIFCCVEPLAGKHILKTSQRRTKLDFAEMMLDIVRHYPSAKRIHCVMDNLNTHRVGSLIKRFGVDMGLEIWERFEIHHTPVHASWLNQAEIQIGMMTRECLGKRRLPSLAKLKFEVQAWTDAANRDRRKIKWTFTARKAREKFKRFGSIRITKSKH